MVKEAAGSHRVVRPRATPVVFAVPRKHVGKLLARHQSGVVETRRARFPGRQQTFTEEKIDDHPRVVAENDWREDVSE